MPKTTKTKFKANPLLICTRILPCKPMKSGDQVVGAETTRVIQLNGRAF
jgi:hypothetical protein